METWKYRSRRDPLFVGLAGGVILILLALIAFRIHKGQLVTIDYALFFIILSVVGILIWMMAGTSYQLDDHSLTYRCGPLRGSVSLATIRRLEVGQTMWSGYRPATARRGIIVHYNKYDEIYISPESDEEFISRVLERCPHLHLGDVVRKG